jgi:hypothetical protein
MNKLIRPLLLSTLLAASVGAAQAANIHLTFAADAEGFSSTAGGLLAHDAAGYLTQTDIDGSDMAVIAPTTLLGNWSGFVGGTLSFDSINLSGVASNYDAFGTITLTGTAGSLSLDVVAAGAPTTVGWTTYSTVLNSATWGPSIAAVLGQVTGLSIVLESHNGFGGNDSEVNGFDNFRVTAAAVPEPESWALVLSGLAVVGAGWARRRAQALKTA